MLNVLYNDGIASCPRDRFMCAIQSAPPGLPMQPTLNTDRESNPIVFATLVWYAGSKLSLGLFYLRRMSEDGRNVSGLSAAHVESSSVVMCHGQLMSMQEYPGPQLYAWSGRLTQKVLKFKGQDCQFVKPRSNVDHMWYEEAQQVIALTQEQLLTSPDSAPTIHIDLYANIPFLDQKDEACCVWVGAGGWLVVGPEKKSSTPCRNFFFARRIFFCELPELACHPRGGGGGPRPLTPTPPPPSLEVGRKVPNHQRQRHRKQFCLMWQRVQKCVFTPCVYTQYTGNFWENSTMDKNGHFLGQSKIIISAKSSGV